MIYYLLGKNIYYIYSAVYESYIKKENPTVVTPFSTQLKIGEVVKEITHNQEGAKRVEQRVKKLLSQKSKNNLEIAMRCCDEDKFYIIFNYIKTILNAQLDVSDNYQDKWVCLFNKLISRVTLEIHRFKGFIRFYKPNEGIYYAPFCPDNDVCELLVDFFKKRFSKIPFILHDENNGVICASYNGKVKVVKRKIKPLKINDEISTLFKSYYSAINIKSRKNLKTMRNFLPQRYTKYMPEKDEVLSAFTK